MAAKSVVKKLKLITESKSIKHRGVYVDISILNPSYNHLTNSVEYGVFKDDGDPAIVPKNIKEAFKTSKYNDVCFSGLLKQIITQRANRMYYKLHTVLPAGSYPPLLTFKERGQWISLAKEHKLLPSYINENTIEDEKDPSKLAKGTFIIDLEEITQSLLYIYLSTIRNIREDPGLPKAVLYLVNDLGMNFYLAYILASKVVMSTSGHHIISLNRSYGMFKQEYDTKRCVYTYDSFTSDQLNEKVTVPINVAVGIQRVVNGSKKYDKRIAITCGGQFECSSIIESVSNIRYEATVQELFDKNIITATMSETDKKAKIYIDKVTNNKTVLACKGVGK